MNAQTQTLDSNFTERENKYQLSIPNFKDNQSNQNEIEESEVILSMKEKMINSGLNDSNPKNVKLYKQMINDYSIEMTENSTIMYTCMMNYFGNYLSKDHHKDRESTILKKCLKTSKINFPDLFVRFLD